MLPEKSDSVNNVIKEINTNLNDLQKAMKDLPDKIAQSVKTSKNEGNESK